MPCDFYLNTRNTQRHGLSEGVNMQEKEKKLKQKYVIKPDDKKTKYICPFHIL
jgi:hypothetical protein